MAKVITKGGKVCVVGGRVITDANGAPCVCGGGGGTDWPCNIEKPTCYRVTLSDFGPSDCENVICSPSQLEPTRAVSADGINGTYIVPLVSEFTALLLVPHIRVPIVGLISGDEVDTAFREFRISLNINCHNAGDNPTDEWAISLVDIRPTLGVCNNQTNTAFFRADLGLDVDPDNMAPFGSELESVFTVDCSGTSQGEETGYINPGTVTIEALVVCPGENNDHHFYAERCTDGERITVNTEFRPEGKYFVLWQGEKYELTGAGSPDLAVLHDFWTDVPCPEPGNPGGGPTPVTKGFTGGTGSISPSAQALIDRQSSEFKGGCCGQ